MRKTRTFTAKERETLCNYLDSIGIEARDMSDDGLYTFMITKHLSFDENGEIVAEGYLTFEDSYNLYMYGNKAGLKQGMTSQAQIRAVDKYDKANTKKYLLKLNLSTDKDIIDHLDSLDNKQGYIKELIRDDLAKGGKQLPFLCYHNKKERTRYEII